MRSSTASPPTAPAFGWASNHARPVGGDRGSPRCPVAPNGNEATAVERPGRDPAAGVRALVRRTTIPDPFEDIYLLLGHRRSVLPDHLAPSGRVSISLTSPRARWRGPGSPDTLPAAAPIMAPSGLPKQSWWSLPTRDTRSQRRASGPWTLPQTRRRRSAGMRHPSDGLARMPRRSEAIASTVPSVISTALLVTPPIAHQQAATSPDRARPR